MSYPYGQQPGNPPQQPYPPQQYGGYHPGPPPPPPRKKSNAPLILVIIGVVLLFLFGGCAAIVAVLGSGGTSAGAPAERVDAGTDADTGVNRTDPPRKSEQPRKKAVEPKAAGIGSVVKDGQFAFKVTKLERQARVGNEFLGTDAQGVFLVVHITVKNIGDEAQTFTGAAQTLHADGKEFDADGGATIYMEDSKSLYENINPGNSVDGVVLFDIPKDLRPGEIELHDSLFSEGVTVKLS
jgi:hypothetical protein